MPKARKRRPPTKPRAVASVVPPSSLETSIQRLTNLLALFVVKGGRDQEKVVALTGAGYSAAEIGQLLGKKPNTVSVALYKASQEPRGQRAPAKGRGRKRAT